VLELITWDLYKDFRKGKGRIELSKKYKVKEWIIRSLYSIRETALKESLVLILSDLHFGTPNFPDDFEDKFLSNLEYILNHFVVFKNIDEVILIELGDIIDNVIHTTQRENNLELSKAMDRARNFYRKVINLLEPDKVIYLVGNHDRGTKDPTTKHYITPTIFSSLKEEIDIYVKDKVIDFIEVIDPSMINIKDWNIVLTHGVRLRTYSNQISGLSLSRLAGEILSLFEEYENGLVKKVEMIFMGHIHRCINYRSNGVEIFINGTSHQKGFHTFNYKSEDLAQWLLTLPPKSFCIRNKKLMPTIGTAIKVWCS
jgi:predicted phosphodiesterase